MKLTVVLALLSAPASAQVKLVPKFRTGVVAPLSTQKLVADWTVYRAAGLALTPAGENMEPAQIDELVRHGQLVNEMNDGAPVVAFADGKNVGFVPAGQPAKPFAVLASAADTAVGSMGRIATESLAAIQERLALGDAEGALVKLRELFGR